MDVSEHQDRRGHNLKQLLSRITGLSLAENILRIVPWTDTESNEAALGQLGQTARHLAKCIDDSFRAVEEEEECQAAMEEQRRFAMRLEEFGLEYAEYRREEALRAREYRREKARRARESRPWDRADQRAEDPRLRDSEVERLLTKVMECLECAWKCVVKVLGLEEMPEAEVLLVSELALELRLEALAVLFVFLRCVSSSHEHSQHC